MRSTANRITLLRSSGVSPTGRQMRVLWVAYFDSGEAITPLPSSASTSTSGSPSRSPSLAPSPT